MSLRAWLPLFRRGSLRLSLVWTLAGNTIQLGSQWGMVMVLAKLGTPALVGEFSLALGLAAPILAVASLGLRNLLVTDAKRTHAYADMLGARVVGVALGMAVIVAIALPVARTPRLLAIYLLVGLARAIDTLSDIHWALMQRAERMDLIAMSQTLRGILGLAALAIAVKMTGSLVAGSAALCLATGAVWLLFDRVAVLRCADGERTTPRFVARSLRPILVLAAPLVLAILLNSISGPMPRYFVEAYRGARDVGFLAVAASPIALVGFLPGAIYQATAARAAQLMQDHEVAAFRALAWKVLAANIAVSGAFFAASILLGPVFLRTFFTPEYLAVWPEMIIFCFAQVVASLGAFGSQVANARRMFRPLAMNAALTVSALAVASFILVPRFGVRGSAWADVIFKGTSTIFLMTIGVWWVLSTRKKV